jgi:phosphoribosylformylglycinamidine synthase
MVRDGSVVCPGSDAAVLRIKTDSLPEMPGSPNEKHVPEKYIAISVDCNGGYVYLDAYEGGKAAVVEAARNLACSGARPLGVTDNLNFGNPHNKEIFWQLRESVRGIGEACRAFDAPVTGGNVSLYNQSPNGPIDPTPTVAMVGIIDDPAHITTQWFKDAGDAIILLGEAVEAGDPLQGLGGSAYLQRVHGIKNGSPAKCDLEKEKNLHLTLRSLIASGTVRSAHDCSEGGLAVALAESCISNQVGRETPSCIGATVDLTPASLGLSGNVRTDALLFGEAQGRIVITTKALDSVKTVERAKLMGVSARRIGTVGGDTLTIKTAKGDLSWTVAQLHDGWWRSIARLMSA